MTLEAHKRIGHYEIVAPIGAGGMGEVYKATDTRLDRTVTVKILPEHPAESGERKERFSREAKAISQLNHPNICTLQDVGNHEGMPRTSGNGRPACLRMVVFSPTPRMRPAATKSTSSLIRVRVERSRSRPKVEQSPFGLRTVESFSIGMTPG